MPPATGTDVESICNKCGDVWHVVVAMVGDKIAKVQCKECGAYHRYRPAGGIKKTAAAPKKRAAAKKKTTKKAPPPAEAAVEPDLSRPTKPYSIKETFEVADRVEHPKFGTGVVERSEPGKIEVFFPVGRKVLVQAKPSSSLQRPPRFEHKTPE